MSYVARRGVDDERGAVQRILNKTRISGIRDFLLNNGFFPNNIILNVNEEGNLSFDESLNILSIDSNPRIAQIIDGQHRVEGLKEAIKLEKAVGEMLIPTVLSNNLETEDCAEIFISINTEQKTVPKSLIYDLYGLMNISAKDFSVERGTDIAKILNTDDSSPYQGYIKFPGSRKFKGGIQLSTLVNSLKPLVKSDGEFSKYSLTTLENQASVLKNYFNAIQSYYGDDWDALSNPFLFASGFSAAIEVFIGKILPHCYATKRFTEHYFKELIVFSKETLIKQAEVKGMGGESARNKIKNRILENVYIEDTNEEEFEI
ncbi:MAG: DGQHR domain-containing protein [Bacteroidales bacterium]|nr:DGQHR domain-containing protein [Bacteroidales bacterium]